MISFEIITLFPRFFASPLKESLLGKAQGKGVVSVRVHDLRDYTKDKHRTADDYPYGGGPGMVLKPEPVVEALETIGGVANSVKILLTPQGVPFTQRRAQELAHREQIILVCGRYEGVDERVCYYVDQELSIGDYVLNGGEAAALVILESVSRLVPGVLGKDESVTDDSFSTGLLEYPHYTRPEYFRGHRVPEILRSGNHRQIDRWRRRESLIKTLKNRPDLIEGRELSDEETEWLQAIKEQMT